jgi:N-methylhydantoinase B/oxoprolinase/acetone carboxylase alpha subunit
MKVIDPIDLEVLRSRLEAIGELSASAVEHTAISPVVTEAKDYSFTLLDASGGLIIGAGQIEFHFGAASHSVAPAKQPDGRQAERLLEAFRRVGRE